MKMQNKYTWVGVFVLVVLDQAIKAGINSHFLDKRFPVLPPILYFEPMFNRDYSWFNSMLQLGISKWVHIAVVVILGTFIYLFFGYLNEKLGTSKTINVLFAFLFSGTLCSLVDKVFWDGSLDYILVKGFFTFDLKDVYINVFIWLLLLSMLLKSKDLQQIDDHLVKGFLKYILGKST